MAAEADANGYFKCFVCGAERKSQARFEKHHILGVTISEQMVLLCKRCHHEVSWVSADGSVRDLETFWVGMKTVFEDKDWRVRMFFLKIMSIAGDKYASSVGLVNPRKKFDYSKKGMEEDDGKVRRGDERSGGAQPGGDQQDPHAVRS